MTSQDDIVERLREPVGHFGKSMVLCNEAADEIERLRGVAQAGREPCPYESGKTCVLEESGMGPCLCVNPVAKTSALLSTPRKTGPLVPWELDCQRADKDCAAPVCDCPPVK